MNHLSQIFWRHSWDVSTQVPNNLRFLVFLSVCSLPQFLTEIQLSSDILSSEWDIFAKFSGYISGIFVHHFKIISDFLYVCWSVHCLTSLLKLLYLFQMSYLFQIFSRHFWDFCTILQIISYLLSVCQSIHCPTSLLKLC